MDKKVNLIVTDSYHNLFPILTENLKEKAWGLNGKNLIFCEEKISLMAERYLCRAFGGTFNTDVYSFGNYLRCKKPIENTLTKEGSAMAVKRILQNSRLKCFVASKKNLAPTLYDVIIQLKSAKVSPEEILACTSDIEGSLKNKLEDVGLVYAEYENFISERGINDQSKILSYLPEVLESDKDLSESNVYLLGYTSFTGQIRDIIRVLIRKARSVTAILTGGDNRFLFLNETIDSIKDLAKDVGAVIEEKFIETAHTKECKKIVDDIFKPIVKDKIESEAVHYFTAEDVYSEIQTIAESIKAKVINGEARYGDFAIATADTKLYADVIKAQFKKLDVPFFLDEKIKPETHPLIKLITGYIEVFDKNMERERLSAFYKNPLFNTDKHLADKFYNYILKYNVNYTAIKKPFTVCDKTENLEVLENFRQKIVSVFEKFNIEKMLESLDVEKKLNDMTARLLELKEYTQAEINKQIYQSVSTILKDMKTLLGGVELSFSETLRIFTSGIMALELSIIPQFSDAVFIGGFKEIALVKTDYLFFIGLTENVPSVKEDVALITDDDINRLSQLKILVEPKIKVVNERAKENLGMALSSFNKKLFLSRPIVDVSGKKTLKSTAIKFFDSAFTLKPYEYKNSYLTKRQGLTAFSISCGDYAYCKIDDFSDSVAYYKAVEGDKTVKDLLEYVNTNVKVKLNGFSGDVVSGTASPTLIEEYYKCPYRAFLTRVLRLKEREDGKISAISVGLFMHAVFKEFLENLSLIDEDSKFEEVFNIALNKVIVSPEYERFKKDGETDYFLNSATKEAREYCYKTYMQFTQSDFKPKYLEKPFEYKLLNGRVKLKGTIDRVDVADDYFRIIDYKTGKVEDKDELLFAGTKLQLYLYASCFKDKKPAGLYYTKVSDDFIEEGKDKGVMFTGKTLDDERAISLQDKEFKENKKSQYFKAKKDKEVLKNVSALETLNAYVNYAEKLCENAVEQMDSGVIASSPFDGACDYCNFKGMCQREFFDERKVLKVDNEVIEKALLTGEKDAQS